MIIEKVIFAMLCLVALYLVIANAKQFETILRALSQFNVAVLSTLQGRNSNAGSFSNPISTGGGLTGPGGFPIGVII